MKCTFYFSFVTESLHNKMLPFLIVQYSCILSCLFTYSFYLSFKAILIMMFFILRLFVLMESVLNIQKSYIKLNVRLNELDSLNTSPRA